MTPVRTSVPSSLPVGLRARSTATAFQFVLNAARNIRFGPNEKVPGSQNNSFLRAAPGARRQTWFGCICYVDSDDSELPLFEFKNILATVESHCLRSICMGIGTEPFQETQ